MSQGYGRLLRRFFHDVAAFLEQSQADDALQEFVFPLAKAFAKLQQASAFIAQKGLKDPNEAGAAATDYLRLFALVAMGYMWARMAHMAQEKIKTGGIHKAAFYETKLVTARFFFARMLPEADARFKAATAGAETLMTMKAEAF